MNILGNDNIKITKNLKSSTLVEDKIGTTIYLKINNKTFYKLLKLYKNLKNKKISMTELLNSAIQKKITNFSYIITNKFWYEVDSLKDLKILKKDIKRFS